MFSSHGKRAPIWHAFSALNEQNGHFVSRSQLMVLSHNLTTSLNLDVDVNKELDSDKSSLNFEEFLKFLEQVFFKKIALKIENKESLNLDVVDDICWLIYSKPLFSTNTIKVISRGLAFKLWRVFNALAEVDHAEETIVPVHMVTEEVNILLQKIHKLANIPYDKKRDFEAQVCTNLEDKFGTFQFQELLPLVDLCLSKIQCVELAYTVVLDLYEEYILGVLKKGYLNKKNTPLTHANRWCVLTPILFSYYTNRDEQDLKGEIKITQNCTVEVVQEKTQSLNTKHHRFVIKCGKKDLEFSAPDSITRSEWINLINSAIAANSANPAQGRRAKQELRLRRISRLARFKKIGIEKMEKEENLEKMEKTQQQLEEEIKRREALMKKVKEEEEEKLRDKENIAKTNEELTLTKQMRMEAEKRWKEAEAEHKNDQEKLMELEIMQKNLEELLEKERVAREKEEDSRRLQEQLAKQEREHNRELEDMQDKLGNLLKMEQEKEQIDEIRKKQEMLLTEGRDKLEILLMEKEEQERLCQEAITKLLMAEKERDEAQKELKNKRETAFYKSYQMFNSSTMETDPSLLLKISHRGKGFIPSNKLFLNSLPEDQESNETP